MNSPKLSHYRLLRRLALVMAAAPLFQLAQCSTGLRQVSAEVVNGLPSLTFSILQGFWLLPAQLFLSLFTGGSYT